MQCKYGKYLIAAGIIIALTPNVILADDTSGYTPDTSGSTPNNQHTQHKHKHKHKNQHKNQQQQQQRQNDQLQDIPDPEDLNSN